MQGRYDLMQYLAERKRQSGLTIGEQRHIDDLILKVKNQAAATSLSSSVFRVAAANGGRTDKATTYVPDARTGEDARQGYLDRVVRDIPEVEPYISQVRSTGGAAHRSRGYEDRNLIAAAARLRDPDFEQRRSRSGSPAQRPYQSPLPRRGMHR